MLCNRNTSLEKRPISLLAFVFILAVSYGSAYAESDRIFVEPLVPSTGLNSDCDTAIFAFPTPFEVDTHFDFIGLYDPAAPSEGPDRDATPLLPADCEESLEAEVATTSNADFRLANGFPEPDSRLKNLRSNEVPVVALPDGTRQFLPAEGETPVPFPPTRSLPSAALTLGEFRAVSGDLTIECFADGTARVGLRVAGYRPNSLVTVWAIWLATAPGAPEAGIVPLPFGGVPNVMSISRDGRGLFVRDLSYCPKDTQPNGDQLMVIDLAEHWDGNTYGAVPDLPFGEVVFQPDPAVADVFSSVIGAGIVTVNRGVINMTLEP